MVWIKNGDVHFCENWIEPLLWLLFHSKQNGSHFLIHNQICWNMFKMVRDLKCYKNIVDCHISTKTRRWIHSDESFNGNDFSFSKRLALSERQTCRIPKIFSANKWLEIFRVVQFQSNWLCYKRSQNYVIKLIMTSND